MIALIALLLATPAPVAAPKAPRCTVVYINGDAVITCPTLIVRGGK